MRFVVLHHTGWPGRGDHYDLMLQLEDGADDDDPVLRAFATLSDDFPDGISHSDTRARGGTAGIDAQINLLRMLDDHRRAYLAHEGPLTGNRGSVQRVEAGDVIFAAPPGPGTQDLRFELQGTRLRGGFRLRPMGSGIYAFERLKRVWQP